MELELVEIAKKIIESAPREPSSAQPYQRVLIPRKLIIEMQNVLRRMGHETQMRDRES
jgi:hypothetical protein